MGMYVIIDWVANHTACDNDMVFAHPEWYTKNKNGDFQPPCGTDWSDVYDLDYKNLELRDYMIGAMEFWVKEYDIDGFRCDVAGMVYRILGICSGKTQINKAHIYASGMGRTSTVRKSVSGRL